MRRFKFLLAISAVACATVFCTGCEPVNNPSLAGITISTQPTKLSYLVGERFDTTGMVITASYLDGHSDQVTNYTYTPNGDLSLDDTKITVSFSGKSAYLNITVSPREEGEYYSGINYNSPTLLQDLRSLNLKKRAHTVGYSSMGTSPSGKFKYTDYDPATVKYDSNGQPYGTQILSFYSGKSCTSWNREHVWPDSRGGGSVDNDIFMTRPTITAENSNRGNSSYVEGMNHSKNGWDPVTAFAKTLGVYQSIRGECARIIFYCLTVSKNLSIREGADISYSNSIGCLSDLLKWNLDNPVNQRELNRQEGGQYLQGNRNAFVDHPEYACKIWGTTNASTKQICGLA